MDDGQQQEEEKKNEGEDVAAEGAGTAEEGGRAGSADLPYGWRVKSNEHTLPTGWRTEPANSHLSATDTHAAGRGEHVDKEVMEDEGGEDANLYKTKAKRKSTRRGSKTKNKTETVNLKLIQTNCDGFTSKKESFDDIVKDDNPDIIVINDTALKGTRKVKIPKYFSYTKNREKNKGGVATVVANYLKPNTVKFAEGKEGDEYVITRFDNTVPAINLINIYGEQEGRSSIDEIEKSWLRLKSDIEEIESRNEAVMIMGDMNRAIGNGNLGIKDNKDKISKGGKMLRDLVYEKPYTILNNLDAAKDGPWTWTDRQNSRTQSCLDLVIASNCLLPYVTLVWVDRERKFTPRRVLKSRKKIKTIYTDHFPIKVELSGIPRRKEDDKSDPTWNLGKPGGWELYEKLTDEAPKKIKDIAEDPQTDINSKTKKN